MSYYKGKVIDRFLDYVSYPTASAYDMPDVPSTERQFALAERLVKDFKEAGLKDVSVDGQCYVYGYLPASPGCEDKPCIGFIAHMDTSPDAPGRARTDPGSRCCRRHNWRTQALVPQSSVPVQDLSA